MLDFADVALNAPPPSLPHPARDLKQSFGADDSQHHQHDDENLGKPYIEHGSLCYSTKCDSS